MAAYATAALLGVALGSYRHLMPAGADGTVDTSPRTTAGSDGPAAPSPASPIAPQDSRTAPEASPIRRAEPSPHVDDEPDRLVFASKGLVLRPAVTGDRFIGFLVVRNDSDRRFSVGDVIVSVNDQPVENSVAGSELLIASLTNPDARVEIRAAKD